MGEECERGVCSGKVVVGGGRGDGAQVVYRMLLV